MEQDLSYDEAQLMLRALRGHQNRMMKIAEQESLVGRKEQAEVAVKESRMAQALGDKLERGGVRIQ